jgi:hypothetical protein
MSETESTAGQPDQADITDYNDPNAPWNQAWDQEGSIANWNDDVIKEFRENSGKVGGAVAARTPSMPRTTSCGTPWSAGSLS